MIENFGTSPAAVFTDLKSVSHVAQQSSRRNCQCLPLALPALANCRFLPQFKSLAYTFISSRKSHVHQNEKNVACVRSLHFYLTNFISSFSCLAIAGCEWFPWFLVLFCSRSQDHIWHASTPFSFQDFLLLHCAFSSAGDYSPVSEISPTSKPSLFHWNQIALIKLMQRHISKKNLSGCVIKWNSTTCSCRSISAAGILYSQSYAFTGYSYRAATAIIFTTVRLVPQPRTHEEIKN